MPCLQVIRIKRGEETWLTSRLPSANLLILAIVLAVSFLVRVLLFPSARPYVNDTNTYSAWFNTAATQGIRPFYNVAGFADYPPFNVYIFWVFGSLAKAVSAFGISTISIVKLAPNLFDLATAALITIFSLENKHPSNLPYWLRHSTLSTPQ